ncbi:hypothetical protein B7R54_08575 [Subtercola boreus]|uniref:SbsA Ig-like domain-containing protein n=1 Tax=Subtercola boreus TaxID=120213 RepID=A0A3E0VH62_9MICO|nr:hypothetical protein [Subtercola boreus]RFA09276.1 hypothetical protein B7R54_08575 [Subtercola boreus]TQL53695.1 hypothetical protein FB464_1212 [Subtercola boreus]
MSDPSDLSDVEAAWEQGGFRVSGPSLPAQLAVVPVGALGLGLGSDLVPMAGSWRRSGGVGHFTPRFPAVAGTAYAVVRRADDRQAWLEFARVDVPAVRLVRSTVVERFDPACDEVPANLLRFALTFSAPMEEGSASGCVALLDESGAELPGSLLGMPPELWDREGRRLTVILEPGRIKRGLQPNVQAGPPLVERSSVTLAVDARLRDASGAALAAGASRTYRIGPPVRSRVDPALWNVRWPSATGAPLVVRFDRPLDRALVRRCLVAVGEGGHPVPGTASLASSATEWTFTPAPGSLPAALRVDTRLEDLAGNSVRRVFDRDLGLPADASIDPGTLILRPATASPTPR